MTDTPATAPIWQDIATAPKDGWFMAHVKKKYNSGIPAGVVTCAHFSDDSGGMFEVLMSGTKWSHYMFDGWQPLPAPPTA